MSTQTSLSASQLARAIRQRETTACDVLDAHLAHIAAHNPRLNAIVTLDEEHARQRALEADSALARGEVWGPLHGVPVTIKDAFATAGLRSTSSFPPLAHYVPKRDATVVARLREAGAIILGKTNCPQLCFGPQTNSPLFGTTNNPWDVRRGPGGSSGGAAAAVASGMSPLDIGSDIGGSIRNPAHYCGIFGLKPTDHMVSTAGHIPPPPLRSTDPNRPAPDSPWGLMRYLLCAGPLARSIEDLRLALSLIAGPDGRRWEVPPVSLADAPVTPLRELRVAWTDDFAGVPVTADTRSAMAKLAGDLAAAGCQVEKASPARLDFMAALQVQIEIEETGATMARSAPLGLPRWLFRAASRAWPKADAMLRGFLRAAGSNLYQYAAALSLRDAMIGALERFLGGYDAWICPCQSTPAFRHVAAATPMALERAKVDIDGRPYSLLLATNIHTAPFNLTGNPVVVLPVAQSREGLPIGVQVVGPRWGDMRLLSITERLCEVTEPLRPPPGF